MGLQALKVIWLRKFILLIGGILTSRGYSSHLSHSRQHHDPSQMDPELFFCLVTVMRLCFQGRGRTWVQPVSAQCSRSLHRWWERVLQQAPWPSPHPNTALFNPIWKQTVANWWVWIWACSVTSHTQPESWTPMSRRCNTGQGWTAILLIKNHTYWSFPFPWFPSSAGGRTTALPPRALLQWIFGVAGKGPPRFRPPWHCADLFQSLLPAKSPTGPNFLLQWKDPYKLSFV